MAQAPQQPQQGGLQPSPGQKAALDQFRTQSKPFGWLSEILQRVMSQGMGPPQIPGQGPAPQPAPKQPTQGQGQGQGKQSSTQGQPPVPGGQVTPGQVPEMANVIDPAALQTMGLLPQTQGDFGWVLQAMQHAQLTGQQKAGTDIAQLIQTVIGGGPIGSGTLEGVSGGASSGGSAGGSAPAAGG